MVCFNARSKRALVNKHNTAGAQRDCYIFLNEFIIIISIIFVGIFNETLAEYIVDILLRVIVGMEVLRFTIFVFVSSVLCDENDGLADSCKLIQSPDCRTSCRELAYSEEKEIHSYANRRLSRISVHCSRSEVRFWNVFKTTPFWKRFREASQHHNRATGVQHELCCKYAVHPSCETQCRTVAKTKRLQNENCNAAREEKLSQCITRVRAYETCCSNSKSEDCKNSCFEHFSDHHSDVTSLHKKGMAKHCGRKSKEFICAFNNSKYDESIEVLLECCDYNHKRKCARKCRSVMRESFKEDLGIFNGISGCLPKFDITHSFYKCIMVNLPQKDIDSEDVYSPTKRNDLPERGTTSHAKPCCARAKSLQCRRWCEQIITSPTVMGLWDEQYRACAQDPREAELSSCMSAILEPCQFGCKPEMQFCTMLNNRPLDLFRRCNSYGDSNAKNLWKLWKYSQVKLDNNTLVFKDLDVCKPEAFKTMACLLVVKPCDHRVPQQQICRSDCEELLSTCLDFEKSTANNLDVRAVCANMLRNENQTNCLSVNDYLQHNNKGVKGVSTALVIPDPVSTPCHGNPCASHEICLLNKECDGRKIKLPCKLYTCVKACPVGDESKLLIPANHFGKLRIAESDTSEVEGNCYEVCECMTKVFNTNVVAYFGRCKKFGCNLRTKCKHGSDTWEHGAKFSEGCNTCICDDGKLICTRRRCLTPSVSALFNHIASRTCICDSLFNPLCASNGMTYPNSCHAKCGKKNDPELHAGDCQSLDPCSPSPCPANLVCSPLRNTCLNPVPSGHVCPQHHCHLNATNTFFSETPSCNAHAGSTICGLNGVTYSNQCELEQSGTSMDYEGPCLPPFVSATRNRCKMIDCPVVHSDCTPVIPPGACCPICGTYLRVMYSKADVKLHQRYIHYRAVTVNEVLSNLKLHLHASACEIYGHLTVDDDLLVLFLSKTTTARMLHVCTHEALRLNRYINEQNPSVTMNYFLSFLKSSEISTSSWHVRSAAPKLNSSNFAVTFVFTLSLFISSTFL